MKRHQLIALAVVLTAAWIPAKEILGNPGEGGGAQKPKEIALTPEEPETKANIQNSIRDLTYPDPTEEVTVIKAPVASPTGNAALSFSVKVPDGRNGIGPQVSIQYSNEGGNGWLGLGWDLPIGAITIETRWGVPRYDPALETETYSRNGMQLSPVAHRAAAVARTAEKQFHPRIEGSFDKIIRHGNNPSNYWWEVISKDGTRFFYGGTPSLGMDPNKVLTDANGNIGYWALAETRNANDNFIRYQYTKVTDAGNAGGNPGIDLYLSTVTYTGHGATPGKYTVEFIRDRQLSEPRRPDVTISARLGFKKVTADLLRKINVKFNNQNIRSYSLNYIQGAFYKTLLQSISEYDVTGALFNTHTFEYYQDVYTGGDKAVFTPLAPEQAWNPQDDKVKGNFITPNLGIFNDNASALSGSKSFGAGFGMALTFGPCGDPVTKTNTAGVAFGVSESSNEGMLALIDINGDGLPDKVFKEGGSLYFRANQSGPDGTTTFGSKRPVNGISNFSEGESFSSNVGIESHFKIFAGFSITNSEQVTSTYFAEANGDQLIDIVRDGVVYFNHLDNAGNPTFTASSNDTPSPINAAAGIDPDLVKVDSAVLEKAIDDHPLHDMVKVWVAPLPGTVSISNPVSLIQDPSPDFASDAFRDGVRAAIQVKGTELWYTSIDTNDFSPKTPTNVGAVAVQPGDRIYFRVQSKFNGSFDQVNWSPQVTYTSYSPEVDANNLAIYQFNAENDFLLSGPYFTGMAIDGTVHIQGNFSKPVTTDDVTVKILKKDSNDVATTILDQGLPWDQATSLPISLDVDVVKGDRFYFSVLSNTNIDWHALQWEPYVFYTASSDPSAGQLYDQNNQPILDFFPTVDFHAFNRLIVRSLPWMGSVSDTDTVIVTPKPGFIADADTGYLVFSIKKLNSFVSKQTVYVNGSYAGDFHPDTVVVFPGERLYLEYHTDSVRLANSITSTLAELDTSGTVFDVVCGLHTPDTTVIFGPMYRHWGQFGYNGNRARADEPIIESDLALPPSFTTKTDPEEIDLSGAGDLDDMQGEYDDAGGSNPKDDKFIYLIPDNEQKMWRGYDNLCYVKKNILSSSRMGKDNLLPQNPISNPSASGAGAAGINKVSVTSNKSVALGIGPGGGSISFGTTDFIYDFKDMNGDNYPDILTKDLIQYTLPFGGLEANARSPFTGEVGHSEHFSVGATLGGTFVLSRAANAGPNSRGARAKASEGDARISAGFTGNFNYNQDSTQVGWMDINGDGLPDRVHEDGTVELNLGYAFLPPEPWGFSRVGGGDETSIGAGLGINIANYSIAAGIGLSRSETQSKTALEDVNGDGLPDYIESIDPLKVRLNTGNGYATAILWPGAPAKINETISTGESANGAFTVGVNFFPCIKIAFNPSAQVSQGANRNTIQLADINGDGFPDFLRSDADNNLMVSLSTINKTNMLRKVNRPMHANITMDYKRVGNSYAMPNSMYTLASVSIFDGVPGDGADTISNSFSYQNGFYERNERDFFGFAKVTTNHLNTRNNNAVYRVQEDEFINDDYYEKSLAKSETLKNAAGDKFSETRRTFQLKDINTGLALPNSFKQSDDGTAFPALVSIAKLFYEGQATPGKTAGSSFSYDLLGNLASATDSGEAGPGDDLTTNTNYFSIPAKYIMNVPSTITVVSGTQVYRQQANSVDQNTGNITENRHYLESGDFAKTNMVYDMYGNVTKLTRPQNLTGQRLSFDYEYDGDVQTYRTKTTDSYGYVSSATYDVRFGKMLSSTDINGQVTQYVLDNVGRLSTLRGPLELASGNPFTISNEYHPEALVPWASAKHYDPSNPSNYIETAKFSDGMGREIQTKKDISLFMGAQLADQEVMQVSGASTYDAFGRMDTLYYPVTEAKGNTGVLNNLSDNITPSVITYDVLDRVLTSKRQDLTQMTMEYGFGTDREGKMQFRTKSTDGNGIKSEKYANIRALAKSVKEQYSQGSDVWTSYDYNAIDELVRLTEDMGSSIVATFDMLGRKTSLSHPDAGLTTYQYDLNGNPVEVVTANLTAGNGIKYIYDRERLIKITYPKNPKNNVTLTYGAAGATFNRAGKILKQVDATGSQEYFYNPLGDVVKNIRVVVVPDTVPLTYTTEWTYDTWHRLTGMTYPDAEKLTYLYNLGGKVASMSGLKGTTTYNYFAKKGYDKFEQSVYIKYGNGTEMTYAYEPDRRRLKNITAKTAGNRMIMNNVFTFDNEDNILRIVNNVPLPNSNLMGGKSDYQYSYDDLYRLIATAGDYMDTTHQNRYTLNMSYNTAFSILNKNQQHEFKGVTDPTWSPRNLTTYNYNYSYNPASKPHAPVIIGSDKFTYDAAGNQTGFKDTVSAQTRTIDWDEENRIKSISDNGQLFRNLYDAAGHRVWKSVGQGQTVKVNGQMVTTSGTGNFRIYVNPYFELRSGSFTKHFYLQGGRITSKYVEGRNPPNNLENFQFYFHSDQVGNSSFITDRLGEVYQHLEYFPYGETFIDEHGNKERTRYLYNGKELDEETALYYYGARYYDPRTSLWESVDPVIAPDNNISPYVYCNANPIKTFDPDGKSGVAYLDNNTRTITIKQNLNFYGTETVKDPQIGGRIAKAVDAAWNDANVTVWVNPKSGAVLPNLDKNSAEFKKNAAAYRDFKQYKVKLISTPKTVTEEQARDMASNNKEDKKKDTDVLSNFIRVENGGKGSESKYSYDSKRIEGGNGGWLTTAQPIEGSTGAHEITHGFGAGHNHDKANQSVMTPIGETNDRGASRKVNDAEAYGVLKEGFVVLKEGNYEGKMRLGIATNPIFDVKGNTDKNIKLSNDSK